ncbi:MFS transporter [Acidiphilium iwatense]|uniref:MFS transporter n=1 Tax=Acidiphilium iwatense TaxID=768198 RepID=A0ABS9DZB0_9PROT|nr:MFS transporter [Acidiphilium iwatense]MCF3947418.1 MFS transporter [Acidiphilium iwatense]
MQTTLATRNTNRPLALATLCGAVLVAQLDTSVVNLATHPIGAYFKADVATLQWVVDAYNLVYAALLLTGGLIADLYGRRRVFIAGILVFTLASLLCAAAPDMPILIGGRALAGVGAALMIPASLSLIRVIWPDPAMRGHALGIWAACNGLSFVIGPTLGGVLIGWFGWRSIFLVVIPVGIATMALAFRALAESADRGDRAFDAAGQILGALGLGGAVFAAIMADGNAHAALIALAAACIAIVWFVVAERRRGAEALVPLGLFRIPAFRGAMLATMAMTFGMYGVLFLQPLVWQSTGGLGPIGAGLALMPMALVFVLVSPWSGALSHKVGTRFMTSGGVAIIGCGLLALAATAGLRQAGFAEIGLVLTGLGMGLATGPLLGVAVGAVPAARSGTAASLINVARMAGATMGVALLGAVFAALHGDTEGLRGAMLLGGLVQLGGAAIASRRGQG